MRNPLFLLNYVVYLYQGVRDLEEIIQIPTEKLLPNPSQPQRLHTYFIVLLPFFF